MQKDTNVNIREIVEDDAEAFLDFCKKLDNETTNMLLEPQERTATVVVQKETIRNGLRYGNPKVIIAVDGDVIVGFCLLNRGAFKRIRHSANIILGVQKQSWRKRIGSKLLIEVENLAKESELIRLELTVLSKNEPAIGLYKKNGFVVEGVRRSSMIVDGQVQDEIYMGKIIR